MSYSNSSALSIEHFRLVNSLEELNNNNNNNRQQQIIITEQLNTIKLRFNKLHTSTSRTKHDLILILHCHFQSSLTQLDIDIFLPGAIKLAGGSSNNITLNDRKIGYQACIELFNEEPHPLKLLLINTIRGDLYASDTLRNSEIRCTMGLRAIISPRIVTPDLIPAVADRVIELFSSSKSSAAIRRLALAALISLLSCSSEFFDISSLMRQTRSLVLTALGATSTSSTSSHTSISERSPKVLLALVGAMSTNSILFPLVKDTVVLKILLDLLGNIIRKEFEEVRSDYHGIHCGWLAVKVLRGIEELMSRNEEDESTQVRVLIIVLDHLDTILDKIDLAFGLLLSSLQTVSTFSYKIYQSLDSIHTSILQKLLHQIQKYLISSDPNLQSLALSSLTFIPSELWSQSSTSSPSSEDVNKVMGIQLEGWGEESWKRIMGYLESRDSGLRQKSLKVLKKVDERIAEMYISRLILLLESCMKETLKGLQNRGRKDNTLELILEASIILDLTSITWIERINSIISTLTPSQTHISQVIVLKTIDRFIYSPDENLQREFSLKLLEEGSWKKDLSLALILAATVGEGDLNDNQKEAVAKVMLEWLLNEEDITPITYIQELLDPFLLSLLRISSRLPSSARQSIHSVVQLLSSKYSNHPSQLFNLFESCNTTNLGIKSLKYLGKQSKKKSWTLPEFGENLFLYLKNPSNQLLSNLLLVEPSPPTSLTSSQFHPSSNLLSKIPLRYDSYQPSLNSVPRESAAARSTSSKVFETKERGRERIERGGKGGMMTQSLMIAGDSALAVNGTDSDEDDDEEEDEREKEESILLENREGSMTPVQIGKREKLESSSTSPPADLLIELSVDPFNNS